MVSYYESGKRKRIANYENNQLIGNVYDYYPNGKLYIAKQYYNGQKLPGDYMYGNAMFIACNDSTGKSLAEDGNGYFIIYDKDFAKIKEEGSIQSGFKNGEWKGATLDSNQITYTEKYNNGVLILGRSIDKNGKNYTYTIRDIPPSRTRIDDPFFKITTSKLHSRVPVDVENRILINFYVEKDGSITGLTFTGNIDYTFKSEILNALEKTKKLNPGLTCGVPVKVFLSLPLNF